MEIQREEKRLQVLFATPLSESEKCSGQCLTKDAVAGYFAPRQMPGSSTAATISQTTTTTTTQINSTVGLSKEIKVSADDLYTSVTTVLKEPAFLECHTTSRAPLPMLAFAKVVMETIVNKNNVNTHDYFDGITMTVPAAKETLMAPQHHSTVGQKLLHVHWEKMHGIQITCPGCRRGILDNKRTNFSKNQILFPLFGLDGPPMWCMVVSMKCRCCLQRFFSNEDAMLVQLPAHVRNTYPVETKCALRKHSHLAKSATNVFDLLMPTYGNGDLCNRLLHHSMNRSYMQRVEEYCSSYKGKNNEEPVPYVENLGYYIACFPPLGDSIRDTCDKATSNQFTPWRTSDHNRHVREIQSVKCQSTFAQDHTHEVCKNYYQKKRIGANALWDVATETGEIASAVIVPSTKTSDFAHAAQLLTKREGFRPNTMYSDTWPAKSDFWEALHPTLKGRLGLFHCLQRMTRTLKKKHVDHFQAITSLLNCVYTCNDRDHDNLLRALKDGTLSTNHSDEDTLDLKASKLFRQRYDKYLRKEIRPTNVLCSMLDDWFDRFKCTASDPITRPARGRKDPVTGDTLFSPETKPAVEECKKKACYIQDPYPLDQMYATILPNDNSPHQLNEYLSHRGESCLESFHLMLAHFGNCGMSCSLADNLNLTGTARFNLSMRHRHRLIDLELTPENTAARKKTPSAYESVVCFFNHSELACVNQIAIQAGAKQSSLPFQSLEPLQPDNGERFFSECLDWLKEAKPRNDELGRCLCSHCGIKITDQLTNGISLP